MTYRLLALDLDGTTLNSKGEFSVANREAIEAVIKRGITVAIITGKMFAASLTVLEKIQGVHYLFASNGANIYDIQNRKELASYPLSKEHAFQIKDLLEHYRIDYRIYTKDAMYVEKESYLVDEIRKQFPKLPIYIGEIPRNLDYYKIYARSEHENLIKYIEEVKKLPVQSHPSDNHNVEMTNLLANKGEALRFLKKYLHIPIEQVMAIGNHDNDLPMFQESGFKIAVDNAPDYVKEQADFVTKHFEQDGVAHALQTFF